MPTIKRYANRKLYDTRAKRYVTLQDLADMIREGQTVDVIDHATGDDLTAQVQAQIIFEQSRTSGAHLPNNILSGLIQASNQTLRQLRTSIWPLETTARLEAELERRLQALVERGELSKKQASALFGKLVSVETDPTTNPFERRLERALERRGVPSRNNVKHLAAQIAELSRELDSLQPRRPRRKKSAP